MTQVLKERRGSPIRSSRFSMISLLLLLAILLGFALRVHDLEGQSMWSDEGLSLYRSQLTLPEIFRNTIVVDGIVTRDTNPPFYFLLLHFFQQLSGNSVFAMRYLGVAVAVLATPFMYNLGAITFGRRVGLIAALLMAISPFHVWQSQVLRNYGLLLTINLLSIYALFRYTLAARGHRKIAWLLVWAGASLLGIYTHYFGFFVFAYGGAIVLLTQLHDWGLSRLLKQRRFWLGLIISLAIIVPALLIALERFQAGQQVDFYRLPFTRIILHAASAFSLGMEPSLAHPWWRFAPIVALALVGVLFGWRWRPLATSYLLGYQIVPLGLLLGLSLINPLYNGTRHLLIGLPPFLIFLAMAIVGPAQFLPREKMSGFDRLWRWLGPVFGVVVVIGQLVWLNAQFTAPELVRDDIRGAAEYLNAHADANDLIVLHDTLIKFTFDHYYHGPAPVEALPKFYDEEVGPVVQALQSAAQGKQHVWFLIQPTPRTNFDDTALIDWVNDHWPRFFNRDYPSLWLRVHLNGYTPQAIVESIPGTATPANVDWLDVLHLHGFEIPNLVPSGEEWWMTFYLSQPSQKSEQHTLSLRLVDEKGQVWSQMDEAISKGFPPAAGLADSIMRYDHRLLVPPGVPPGPYQLWARLVRTADQYTVPTASGEVDVHLTDVTVGPATCDVKGGDLPATNARSTRLGRDIELVGYTFPGEIYRPGHPISLDLWWCARRQPQSDYRLRLELLDEDNNIVSESTNPLTRLDHPPTLWQPDELIMGKAAIFLPADLSAGPHELQLSLLPADSDEPLPAGWLLGPRSVSLGSVQVEPWPLVTELPAIPSPLVAEFNQPPVVELLGYGLTDDQQAPIGQVEPGDAPELTLFWRSLSDAIPSSYTVFVHLADADERIVAQGDSLPGGGFRPTTSWRSGEVIQDVHPIFIPTDLPTGAYDLWIGFYDPITGLRLPVFLNGERQADDRLFLSTLNVSP